MRHSGTLISGEFRIVWRRDFGLYLATRFCTGAGVTMLRAGVGWHVFALSHSAFHLGLIGLVQFLPALALSLVAGAVADTYDRRKIMISAELVALLCSAVLMLQTWRNAVTLPLLYGTVLCVSVATTFDNPARAALLPMLVPRLVFPKAVAVSSTNQALAFVTGPAACGLLIGASSVVTVYAAFVVLMAIALVCVSLLPKSRQESAPRVVTFAGIRQGLSYVRQQPVILGCMTLDMFAVIFGGASALLPIYASDILHVGARGYGLLAAALDLGAFLMSLALLALPPIVQAGRALLIGVGVYGVATILFGLSRSFPLSVIAYMVVGAADQVSVVMRSAAIQLSTPDALRGRVSSINMIFIGASNQLGAVESGFLAALTSATFSVVSGGLGCLAVLALVAVKVPELRRYRLGMSEKHRM